MEKSIQLLKLLASNRTYSTAEIMERFEISERSVYRYLNQIEDNGFVLERQNGRYRLAQNDSETVRLQKLFHFTEEEIFILHRSLSNFELSNTAVKNLVKKLHALYDFQTLTRLKKDGNIENIQKLARAITDKNCSLLLKYRSSNSETVSDRKVEAFEFSPDYEAIWCLDLEDKKVKQFRISRINEVEILKDKWQHASLHQVPFTDAFRMSAEGPITTIKAILSLKAYNLLREEFPAALPYLEKRTSQYYLEIPIADFHGIGRFVMGLPEDIEITESEEFKDFLREKQKNFKW